MEPEDYVLFVDKKPVDFIKAKKEEERHKLSVHNEQTEGYTTAKLKHV